MMDEQKPTVAALASVHRVTVLALAQAARVTPAVALCAFVGTRRLSGAQIQALLSGLNHLANQPHQPDDLVE